MSDVIWEVFLVTAGVVAIIMVIALGVFFLAALGIAIKKSLK